MLIALYMRVYLNQGEWPLCALFFFQMIVALIWCLFPLLLLLNSISLSPSPILILHRRPFALHSIAF